MHTILDPSLRLDPDRWQRALDLVQGWCDSGELPSAGLIAGRGEDVTEAHFFGKQTPADDSPPIRKDAIFLVASITKPVVATAILMLVERGLIVLGDRVEEYVPEFRGKKKRGITLRHLLTHTSGLPDMLPNNRELREANSPFSQFIAEICDVTPDFPPGRGLQYQSMGIAMLGEIIKRVSGKSHSEFVREDILRPLGMHDSELGAPDLWYDGPDPVIRRVVELKVPEDQQTAVDWNWNSRYWLQFGAPWGGTSDDSRRSLQVRPDDAERRGMEWSTFAQSGNDRRGDSQPNQRLAGTPRNRSPLQTLGLRLENALARTQRKLRRPPQPGDLWSLGFHRQPPLDRSPLANFPHLPHLAPSRPTGSISRSPFQRRRRRIPVILLLL